MKTDRLKDIKLSMSMDSVDTTTGTENVETPTTTRRPKKKSAKTRKTRLTEADVRIICESLVRNNMSPSKVAKELPKFNMKTISNIKHGHSHINISEEYFTLNKDESLCSETSTPVSAKNDSGLDSLVDSIKTSIMRLPIVEALEYMKPVTRELLMEAITSDIDNLTLKEISNIYKTLSKDEK